MKKKHILFVDDEANVLNGLRRTLRPLLNEWGMAFAESGPAALALMAERPFDVLVTDMRMPGMDGLQLLEQVRERYPHTVRFVLSGYSDQEVLVRTLGLAHQFLIKPCSVETLKEAIARTDTLWGLVANPMLQQVVSKIGTLPTLPSLYLELINLLAEPNTTPAQVGTIIAGDPGLTAKVLQLINSGYFSLRKRITDPQQAAIYLGLDTLQALANTVVVFSVLEDEQTKQLMDGLYTHAVRVGRRAKLIAQHLGDRDAMPRTAMVGGMLHDVGKLVLYSHLHRSFIKALWLSATEPNLPLYRAEREILGVTHAEIGAYLLALWGFEEELVQVVAFHHEPSQVGGFNPNLAAVHVADSFDHVTSMADGRLTVGLDVAYLQRAGIAAEQIVEWYVDSDTN